LAETSAPLVLLSDVKRETIPGAESAGTYSDDGNTRLRNRITAASNWLTNQCNRRFDYHRKTRRYSPRHINDGGDLLSAYELCLGADLREVKTITNGDGNEIGSGYVLTPRDRDEKWNIRLTPGGTTFWTYDPTGDWWQAIAIDGYWCYGGEWIDTGETVQNDPLAAAGVSITLSDGGSANVEQGMLFKLDDGTNTEFMLAGAVTNNDSPAADAVAVTRAYNGTTAAEFAQGETIYYFKADPFVRTQILHLCQWLGEREKSPMSGKLVITEAGLTLDIDKAPNDVMAAIERLKWKLT
jgi:hypothetical protein